MYTCTRSRTVAVGGSYSFTPTVSDTTGGKPGFSISGKPSWATFNTATGQLSGKPTTAGKYTNIGIQAYDGKYTSSVLWFGITVGSSGTTTPTITLSGTPSKTATVGKAYSFQPTAKDSAGKTIPAWYIQEVTAQLNGKTVLTAEWGPSVAKNPFLQFTVKGAKAGDKIAIAWVDNRGDKRTDEATVS